MTQWKLIAISIAVLAAIFIAYEFASERSSKANLEQEADPIAGEASTERRQNESGLRDVKTDAAQGVERPQPRNDLSAQPGSLMPARGDIGPESLVEGRQVVDSRIDAAGTMRQSSDRAMQGNKVPAAVGGITASSNTLDLPLPGSGSGPGEAALVPGNIGPAPEDSSPNSGQFGPAPEASDPNPNQFGLAPEDSAPNLPGTAPEASGSNLPGPAPEASSSNLPGPAPEASGPGTPDSKPE